MTEHPIEPMPCVEITRGAMVEHRYDTVTLWEPRGKGADAYFLEIEVLAPPFVCPGCYAVNADCLPGCVDNEIRQEREDRHYEEWSHCERMNSMGASYYPEDDDDQPW